MQLREPVYTHSILWTISTNARSSRLISLTGDTLVVNSWNLTIGFIFFAQNRYLLHLEQKNRSKNLFFIHTNSFMLNTLENVTSLEFVDLEEEIHFEESKLSLCCIEQFHKS